MASSVRLARRPSTECCGRGEPYRVRHGTERRAHNIYKRGNCCGSHGSVVSQILSANLESSAFSKNPTVQELSHSLFDILFHP